MVVVLPDNDDNDGDEGENENEMVSKLGVVFVYSLT